MARMEIVEELLCEVIQLGAGIYQFEEWQLHGGVFSLYQLQMYMLHLRALFWGHCALKMGLGFDRFSFVFCQLIKDCLTRYFQSLSKGSFSRNKFRFALGSYGKVLESCQLSIAKSSRWLPKMASL